jgi:hypothetical protein
MIRPYCPGQYIAATDIGTTECAHVLENHRNLAVFHMNWELRVMA